jgi:hypothetical protein
VHQLSSLHLTSHLVAMFFQGDLQSGISQAIQEHKLVACFVRQGTHTRQLTHL